MREWLDLAPEPFWQCDTTRHFHMIERFRRWLQQIMGLQWQMPQADCA